MEMVLEELTQDELAMLERYRGKRERGSDILVELTALKEKAIAANTLVTELVEMVKANEWQTHHAAENTYCPYCTNDSDGWNDQVDHHEGCKFVALIGKAEDFLKAS